MDGQSCLWLVRRVQGALENLRQEHKCGREVEEGVLVDLAYGAATGKYKSLGAHLTFLLCRRPWTRCSQSQVPRARM